MSRIYQFPDPHPSEDELEAYARGQLEPARLPAVEEHILVCSECQEEVQATISLIEELRRSTGPTDISSRRRKPS